MNIYLCPLLVFQNVQSHTNSSSTYHKRSILVVEAKNNVSNSHKLFNSLQVQYARSSGQHASAQVRLIKTITVTVNNLLATVLVMSQN